VLTLAQHYGQTGAAWNTGDVNADGTVSFDDLLALAQHYGQTLAMAEASAVPEPGGIAVFAIASLMMCVRRRNRSINADRP